MYKYGCWQVNGLKFQRKIDALIYASNHNAQVNFYYHNEIWEAYATTINRDLLGKQNLNQLYKERAQQLRDTYKHLILYYSGGADSHNILRTFLDNNIKLDEICIKWPKFLLEGKLYKANIQDTSTKNYWSEWDFAIKPILDYLKQYHANIKITFVDYSENLNDKFICDILGRSNHYAGGAMLYSCVHHSKQNAAHIYGIDKPQLTSDGKSIKMIFTDMAATAAISSPDDPYALEFFYWTPDMPQLAIEMAYQMSEHYVYNIDDRKYLWGSSQWESNRDAIGNFQHHLAIKTCYDTWDYRFQTKKAVPSLSGHDKWHWFRNYNEFKRPFECISENYTSLISNVSDIYLSRSDAKTSALKTCYTSGFYIRTI